MAVQFTDCTIIASQLPTEYGNGDNVCRSIQQQQQRPLTAFDPGQPG